MKIVRLLAAVMLPLKPTQGSSGYAATFDIGLA